jgi:starch synthase (maltosyl-transferring)
VNASRRTPLIYNLFPLLVGSCDEWGRHAERAANMGFNWAYINPVHYPGFSGSLYAVKHYDRVHPMFAPKPNSKNGLEGLIPAFLQMSRAGLSPMMDLVINHTAIDSPLVAEHPEWYVRDHEGKVQNPFAVDPDDPDKRTVWGDLAEIDNRHSPDRQGLWEFWGRLLDAYLDIGIEGFRCDAAYKVPVELWQFLIARAAARRPDVVFWAENLGCTKEETRALRSAGFQFLCNSSKWWNFTDPWCLEQHREFQDLPSIAFPETHDTPRLALESGGSEAVQRQRYAFAATFSSGLMIPIGFEFGFQRPLHVVSTKPEDWEESRWDLQHFIRAVNRWKLGDDLWQGEGELTQRTTSHSQLCVLERRSLEQPDRWGVICINVDGEQACEIEPAALGPLPDSPRVWHLSRLDHAADPQPVSERLSFGPSEVLIIS